MENSLSTMSLDTLVNKLIDLSVSFGSKLLLELMVILIGRWIVNIVNRYKHTYETACRSFIGHFYQEFGEYHPEFHFSDYHYQCFRYRDKLIHRFICFCRCRCRYGIERYTAKFCRWSDDTAFQTV